MTLRRSMAAVRRRLARQFARKTVSVRIPAPVISFTFDDFPRSAAVVGSAILNSFGLHGTYYAALGLFGKETEVGTICTMDDLEILLGQGHEVGCHTMDHLLSSEVAVSDLVRNCAKNRHEASKRFGDCLRNFAFPQGDVTVWAK